MNLLVFILVVVVTIFIFRKIRTKSIQKGRSTRKASVTAGIISFFAFVFLLGLSSGEHPSGGAETTAKEQASPKRSMARLTDTSGNVTTFDLTDAYQKAIYDKIKAMPDTGSVVTNFTRDRDLDLFRSYGLSDVDFDRLVLPGCTVKSNHMKSVYHSETSLWLPLNNDNYVVSAEIERRKAWNDQYYKRLTIVNDNMLKCFYTESQKQPMHIPREPENIILK